MHILSTSPLTPLPLPRYVKLVDRTKDLIKTGGEWIPSVQVENEIMDHPDVAEAAIIAVHSKKWMERPIACVVMKEGAEALTLDVLNEFLAPRMAKVGRRSGREYRMLCRVLCLLCEVYRP